MDSLLFTLNAVLPIIFCILIGYIIKLLKIFPDEFWQKLNKLCFRLLLPFLLFKNIYDIKSITLLGENWQALVFASVAIISFFFIGLLIVILLVKDDKQKGVVLQCIFRSNYAIIGIGLIELLAVGENLGVAKGIGSVIAALSIPLFNILATISLTIFIKDNDNNKISIKNILLKIIKNPLIIAVFLGLIVISFRSLIPTDNMNNPVWSLRYFNEYGKNDTFIYTTIKYIAQSASPIALIALGGGFRFSAVKKLKYQIILGVSARIIIVPVVSLYIAYLFKFDNSYFPALIALFATPVAVSSVPMSSEMNNDSELAGQLVVWTTILSAFTLFLIILVCRNIGLL